MWRIIHLTASTKSGVDAIATKGGIDADTRFLDCLGYAGESRDLRQLTGGNVWNDDKGMYVHDPLTAEEILGEATRISFPLSSILFIEKVD
mgnify:CR=1 FL=1